MQPALNIFLASKIHDIFIKYIYFIMTKVVNNTLPVYAYIQTLTIKIMIKINYNFKII